MLNWLQLPRSTDVFAKLTPDQKARIVTVLREAGHTVGFMGDGINDAAAMKVGRHRHLGRYRCGCCQGNVPTSSCWKKI